MDYTGKGKSNEWYTPEYIFRNIGLLFDLDPCGPDRSIQKVPAHKYIMKTYSEDGLGKKWEGLVFMNPPWSGKRGAISPWLEKFTKHGNGIAIFPSRTSCDWFHKYIPLMDAILLPKGKTAFISPSGDKSQPMAGVVLGAMGKKACDALFNSDIGIYLEIK